MSSALIQSLVRPETYVERPSGVTLVETHISWVFLTDRFAYKLKKPVRFDFVDFSTAELRRRACEEEVRLNRRLATDVYLGIVAVRRDSDGKLSLDENPPGAGRPKSKLEADGADVVDWLVKMQRLPADRTLSELHRSHHLSDADLGRLACRLVGFYRQVTLSELDPREFCDEIERHVVANRSELLAHRDLVGCDREGSSFATVAKRIHAAQLRMLKLQPHFFESRVAAGRIVDGHGDLRPEHIYLLPEPAIIDCIEFSQELRKVDVADELSFLEEECDFINAAETGRRIAQACFEGLDDHPPTELLVFYRSYRACVRAKVAMLRSRQLDGRNRRSQLSQGLRHLKLADQYAQELPMARSPMMFVVHGLSGTGKSTLAAVLAKRFGMELLATDKIRQRMFGTSSTSAGYNEQIYQPQNRLAVYEALFSDADCHLKDRVPMVLDGTFLTASLRHAAARVAERHGARLVLVHCRCPAAVAMERIRDRLSRGEGLSEARPDHYKQQSADEEPSPTELEEIEIDTTTSLSAQLDSVLRRLQRTAIVSN